MVSTEKEGILKIFQNLKLIIPLHQWAIATAQENVIITCKDKHENQRNLVDPMQTTTTTIEKAKKSCKIDFQQCLPW